MLAGIGHGDGCPVPCRQRADAAGGHPPGGYSPATGAARWRRGGPRPPREGRACARRRGFPAVRVRARWAATASAAMRRPQPCAARAVDRRRCERRRRRRWRRRRQRRRRRRHRRRHWHWYRWRRRQHQRRPVAPSFAATTRCAAPPVPPRPREGAEAAAMHCRARVGWSPSARSRMSTRCTAAPARAASGRTRR